MAEITSPISGGIQVAKRTVSADAFTGRSSSQLTVAQPDPVTTSLISRNTLSLTTVSGQLQSISQQMSALNASLQSAFVNISSSTELEKRKDLQEQEQERSLAEQQIREGKESLIERKIQTALVSPVQNVASKTSFTLSRLMGFFTTLLGGWLLNEGIQTIKALSEDNQKKLNQIKDNVVRNLGIIGSVYAAVRFGLSGVLNIISRITSKVNAAVSTNLFLRPVQALLDGVKGVANKIIPKIKNLLPGFSRGGAPTGGSGAPAVPTPNNIISGLVTGTVDMMKGGNPVKAYTSNIAGAGLAGIVGNIASKIPGPPLLKAGAGLVGFLGSYGPLVDLSKSGYDKITEMFSSKKESAKSTSKVSPSPINGKISSLAFTPNVDLSNKKQTENIPGENQDFSKPAQSGETTVSQLTKESTTNTGVESKVMTEGIPAQKSQSSQQVQISPLKSETTTKVGSIGPLPEPSPTVIPLPLQTQPTLQQPAISGSTGAANNVPTFPTSNPDNFYTLYSQVHYNVVI